ncbi:hypothetical protein OE88DRAFT_1736112 [Heliocybe sulcata]|uniref:Protein-S-isoprenylcysteine O-methyltransferase n=1 Tax=Heliocybe sulcata TaxID=5364 RepID=A0A5C3N0N4_9AGAM|nr:hypothetical protein OE88DRAFT_1736112 [Heliocybe sulcata]
MSLYRIPLILLVSGSMQLSLTNPSPAVTDEERLKYSAAVDGRDRNIVRWTPTIIKYGQWLGAACEITVILAKQFPYSPIADHTLSALMKSPKNVSLLRVSTPCLIGAALSTWGALVRYWCYRTLEKDFTFTLALRKDHKLGTSGPYAIVRHPSYTGYIAAFTGVWVCWFGRGSWVRESGVLDSVVGGAAVGAIFAAGLSLVYLCLTRPVREDRVLRGQFGKEWDEWARRVPYRLFPYIW